MNRRRPLATLLTSLALHGGVLLAVLVLAAGPDELGALFIDLTEWAEARAAGGDGAVAAPPPAVRRASAGAARTGRALAQRGGARPAALQPESLVPAPTATSSAPAPPVVATDAPVTMPPRAPEVRAPGPSDAAIVLAAGASSPSAPAPGPGRASDALPPSGAEGKAGGRAGVPPGLGARPGGVGGAPNVSQGFALAIPGTGSAAPGADEYGAYLGRLRQRVQGSLKYPLTARRRGLAGTVNLEIVIRPDGTFSVVSVTDSSSHAMLDAAALETVKSLAPEPFPPDVPPRILRVRLPVVFALE